MRFNFFVLSIANSQGGDTVDVLRVRRILRATRRNNRNDSTTNGTANERPAVRPEDRHQENSIRLAISAILEVENRVVQTFLVIFLFFKVFLTHCLKQWCAAGERNNRRSQ